MTIRPVVYSIFLLELSRGNLRAGPKGGPLSQKYRVHEPEIIFTRVAASRRGDILTAVRLVAVLQKWEEVVGKRWCGEKVPGECFSCSDRRGNGIHGESLSYSARAIVKQPSFVPRRHRLARCFQRSETEASLTEGVRR